MVSGESVFLAVVFLAIHWGQLAGAQTFDGVYTDSPQPKLSEPLQWLVVLKPANKLDAGAEAVLPVVFITAPQTWPFQNATPRTQLPTSPTQNVWMRFTLAPTATVNTWFLRVPRVNPVKITLFSRAAEGAWQAQSAGNLVAPAQWPLRTRTPTFELKTSITQAQTYFICLENQSVMAELPQMLSAIEYITAAYGVGAMVGVLIGVFSL